MQQVRIQQRNGYAPPKLGYPWLEIFSSDTKPGEIVKISPSVWVTYEMSGNGIFSHGKYIYYSAFVVSVNAGKTWHKDIEKYISPAAFKNTTITPAEHQVYKDAMNAYQLLLRKERKKALAKASLERRKKSAAAQGISLKELSEQRKEKIAHRKEIKAVEVSIGDTQSRIDLTTKLRELAAEVEFLLNKIKDETEELNLRRIHSAKKNIGSAIYSIKLISKIPNNKNK